ncbi:membrane protein FxsA [Bacillus sp. FJAT-50079]|nr:FxsA family protein [Bacillus sp. FJAT-50079]MBS4208787.1 membrane protein FxsA [Bacillus sp. FJAT-50079]
MKYGLILLFIVVPALEIGMFILAGKAIGVFSTVMLIIATGILGAYFAKRQGMSALRKVQEQLRLGQPPGNALLDGVCGFVGGILLLSPGFITDAIGLLLLLPFMQKYIRPILLKVIKNWFSGHRRFYIYR